jgi:DNA (cytosine-5)-methyltransferase 1
VAGEETRQGTASGAQAGAGASGGNPNSGQGYITTGKEKKSAPENRPAAFACNQRDEVRNLHDVSGAIQAQPGMKQQTFIAAASMNCLTPWDTQQERVFTEESVAPTLAGADGGGGRNPGGLIPILQR